MNNILHFLFLNELSFKISLFFFIGGGLYSLYALKLDEVKIDLQRKRDKVTFSVFFAMAIPLLIIIFSLIIKALDYISAWLWA